jgi:hypothetical protein
MVPKFFPARTLGQEQREFSDDAGCVLVSSRLSYGMEILLLP